ncbi:MAG: hypothetical protein QM484_13395 [Woeseiaceae bacterium]
MSKNMDHMNASDIGNAIHMINEHIPEARVQALIPILESLKKDLGNEALVEELSVVWRSLGIYQGSVLTYVPYFFSLIPDDIFGD